MENKVDVKNVFILGNLKNPSRPHKKVIMSGKIFFFFFFTFMLYLKINSGKKHSRARQAGKGLKILAYPLSRLNGEQGCECGIHDKCCH